MSSREADQLMAFLERNPTVRRFHSQMLVILFTVGFVCGLVLGLMVR